MKLKKGVTLVEVLIAATIMIAVVGAGFSLLQSGSKAAGKGGAYLINSMAAGNLARRLEIDIESSSRIEVVSQGSQGEIKIFYRILGTTGKLENLCSVYTWPAENGEGVMRKSGDGESNIFCSDRVVELLELSKHEFDSAEKKRGYQINLSITSKTTNNQPDEGAKELVNIKRFAFAYNSNANNSPPFFNSWQGSP